MNTIVRQVLMQPEAYLLVSQIQRALHDEHTKRQHFYEIIDENTKMEFINGEIVYHSPVMMRHNLVTKRVLHLIDFYVQIHHLGFVGVEKILISLSRNDYEPDICFFRAEKAAVFSPNQARFPAPDLIVEILSDSTEHRDRTTKFLDYAAHGVEEYWIINPETEIVEQYRLDTTSEQYDLTMKSGTGVLVCGAINGFNVPVRALFDDAVNMQAVKELLI